MEQILYVQKTEKSTYSTDDVIKIFNETEDLDKIRKAVEKAEERLFVSWASVDMKDKAGERIPIQDLITQISTLKKRGAPIMDNHTSGHVGKTLEFKVMPHPETETLGILQLNQIFADNKGDDKVWKEIVEGKRVGMSVGGIAEGTTTTRDKDGDSVDRINNFVHRETSTVFEPCNPLALNEAVSVVAKSDIEKYIRRRGDEWCVFSRDGEKIACHKTKEEALAQLRAIEAQKMSQETQKQDDPARVCGFIWNDGTDAQRGAFGGGTEGRGRDERPPKAWWSDCTKTIAEGFGKSEKMVDEKKKEDIKKENEEEMTQETPEDISSQDMLVMIQQLMERVDELEEAVAGKPEEEEKQEEEEEEEKPEEEEEEKKKTDDEETTEEEAEESDLEKKLEEANKKIEELEKKFEAKQVIKANRPKAKPKKKLSPYDVAIGKATAKEVIEQMRGD